MTEIRPVRRPSLASRAIQRIGRLVPPWLGGQLHRAPPALTFGLTGPFNGQRMRVAAVRAMFGAVPFTAVVETGTYRALTTRFLRGLTDAPLATIEINPRYHDYSRKRLAGARNVYPFLGSSPEVLELLAADASWTSGPTFFYLDAHWLNNLPLVDELRIIRRAWPDFVALIDDFKVDGDEGYGYDDYGPGKSLELSLVGLPEFAGLRVFWPAMPADRESGMRQGYVVLATPGAMAEALAGLAELRDDGALGAG
ncbi:MAG TPA: hypothetical protein VNT28_00035 [Candidatus Limnocylindrales bacterium]|nr:hypothetical protein [Candidatus Limnocylindrales bacterium]